MTYLRSRSTKNKRGRFFLLFIVVFLIVSIPQVRSTLSGAVHFVATPMWKGGEVIEEQARGIIGATKSKRELVVENNKLKSEIREISAKLLDRNLLYEENVELKEALGRDAYEEFRVFAQVLSSPSKTPYDTLILDAGLKDNISVGDRVVFNGSIVIGEISEVFARSSKAIMFSSPGEEIDVIIGESIRTVAEGRGAGNFEITLPRDIEISIGDIVRIPDIATGLAGIIEHIEVGDNDPSQTLFFKHPINIFELTWIEILTTET